MAKNSQAAQGMHYIGNGAFILGVPARDLTMAEWADLPSRERSLCTALKLYEPMGAPQASASSINDSEVNNV